MTITAPATDKQIAFIHRLIADREVAAGSEDRFAAQVEAGLTKVQASANIDMLLSLPKKPVAHADGAPLTEGYYLQSDSVYRIVKAKHSDNLYGKVLITTAHGTARYEYAPGAMRHLIGADRLTVEQAAEMGVKHGICVVCAATLTDPASVARGIGPTCARRLAA